MDRRRLKFLLLGLGALFSVTFLLVVGMNRPGGMMYYLTVTEFVQQADNAAGDYKINGKVSTGSIERMNTGMDVRFIITDGASSLPVSYHGVIPDTFVEDAAVVVEGRLRDGTFVAHNLLAKCPSKYEAADGDETARLEASLRD